MQGKAKQSLQSKSKTKAKAKKQASVLSGAVENIAKMYQPPRKGRTGIFCPPVGSA
jgi:hypothetical protein